MSQDVRADKIGPAASSRASGCGHAQVSVGLRAMRRRCRLPRSCTSKWTKPLCLAADAVPVEPEDLATGNAADGRGYFNGAGGCSGCHSATGDLAGIATRFQGLTLLQRMLYPSGRPAPALPKATFTLASGQTVVAPLTAEDEFSVTVMDPAGAPQTYQRSAVKVKIENPMSAHFDQLGKYTDATMHNIYAYLETLK